VTFSNAKTPEAGEYAEARAFVAVAEARSFRRAALDLCLTPSTLSHAVHAFEDRLGQRLLNRATRAVTATEAGARLLQDLTPASRCCITQTRRSAPVRMLLRALSGWRHPGSQSICSSSRRSSGSRAATRDVRTIERPGDLLEGFDLGIQLGNDVATTRQARRFRPPCARS
jgi:DNA-binding transcriptional LysR family regulator